MNNQELLENLVKNSIDTLNKRINNIDNNRIKLLNDKVSISNWEGQRIVYKDIIIILKEHLNNVNKASRQNKNEIEKLHYIMYLSIELNKILNIITIKSEELKNKQFDSTIEKSRLDGNTVAYNESKNILTCELMKIIDVQNKIIK